MKFIECLHFFTSVTVLTKQHFAKSVDALTQQIYDELFITARQFSQVLVAVSNRTLSTEAVSAATIWGGADYKKEGKTCVLAKIILHLSFRLSTSCCASIIGDQCRRYCRAFVSCLQCGSPNFLLHY